MSKAGPMEPYDRETNYSLDDGYPTPGQRRRYRKKQNRLYGAQIFIGGMGVATRPGPDGINASCGKGRATPRRPRRG